MHLASSPLEHRLKYAVAICRDADDAVREMDGRSLCGERIRVEHARSRDFRGGDRGGSGGRDGGRDGPRRGTAPGPRTNYRIIVDNLSRRTSWQVCVKEGSRFSEES